MRDQLRRVASGRRAGHSAPRAKARRVSSNWEGRLDSFVDEMTALAGRCGEDVEEGVFEPVVVKCRCLISLDVATVRNKHGRESGADGVGTGNRAKLVCATKR